ATAAWIVGDADPRLDRLLWGQAILVICGKALVPEIWAGDFVGIGRHAPHIAGGPASYTRPQVADQLGPGDDREIDDGPASPPAVVIGHWNGRWRRGSEL